MEKCGAGNWNRLAQFIPGREGWHCRQRWMHQLDPSLNKGPWTPEEDQLLISLQEQQGNRWSEIAKFFPGRCSSTFLSFFFLLIVFECTLLFFSSDFFAHSLCLTRFRSNLVVLDRSRNAVSHRFSSLKYREVCLIPYFFRILFCLLYSCTVTLSISFFCSFHSMLYCVLILSLIY